MRDRRGETLFIDARKLGALVDRTHKELTNDDVARIADTYHAWRAEADASPYEDVAAFCASATVQRIAEQGFLLTPGRYVGAEEAEADEEPVADKISRLVHELTGAFEDSDRLQAAIRANLRRLNDGE